MGLRPRIRLEPMTVIDADSKSAVANNLVVCTNCDRCLRNTKTAYSAAKTAIVDYSFKLNDLNSRSKNFLLCNIEKPGDDLMFALILKNLSDRQISIDKKLVDFIIKRIERSYGKIFDFIYKIDKISLKLKKPIDFKIIKEALGE